MNAELKQNTSPGDGLAPVYAQYPIEVVGADGVWLHTRDGRKVLDLYGGPAVPRSAMATRAGRKRSPTRRRR